MADRLATADEDLARGNGTRFGQSPLERLPLTIADLQSTPPAQEICSLHPIPARSPPTPGQPQPVYTVSREREITPVKDKPPTSHYGRIGVSRWRRGTFGGLVTGGDGRAPDEVETAVASGALRSGLLRRLSDALPHMAWSARADGAPDFFNTQWYAFTGAAPGSTDGDLWQTVVHGDDLALATAAWAASVASGDPYEVEYRLRHVTDGWRWVVARALPVRGAAGEIVRWVGTCTDIDATRRAAELNRLLSRELDHRIKNLFSVIDGLVQQSAKGAPALAPLAADLRERIGALARAHDYVRPRDDGTVGRSLKAILGEILRPYPAFDEGRIVIAGDDVTIAVAAATPLALAVHELATNAMKYGALAQADGVLHLAIGGDPASVALNWREAAAPASAEAPRADGFGSGLIDLAIRRQLGGRIERAWMPSGLQVTMTIPADRLQRA